MSPPEGDKPPTEDPELGTLLAGGEFSKKQAAVRAKEAAYFSSMNPSERVRSRMESLSDNKSLSEIYFKATPYSLAHRKDFGNQIHRFFDYFLGVGAYTFGSLMHMAGQGSLLCTTTMCVSGTCFFINATNRNLNGPIPEAWNLEAAASWMWMLTSFQNFQRTRLLAHAGYSSWIGLIASAYYSTRWVVQKTKQVAEDPGP